MHSGLSPATSVAGESKKVNYGKVHFFYGSNAERGLPVPSLHSLLAGLLLGAVV